MENVKQIEELEKKIKDLEYDNSHLKKELEYARKEISDLENNYSLDQLAGIAIGSTFLDQTKNNPYLTDEEKQKQESDLLALVENDDLKKQLEEANEKNQALENGISDIEHYLSLIRDVFYDLNKKDIYRNNF